ncbi:MAG TPA: C25 family cysteine peptidase [Blastocatellia bacterium]|nr:C25 family cysteine peptidase [Blastocatellia bacterium]
MKKISPYLKPTFFNSRLYIALIAIAILAFASRTAFMQKANGPGETATPAASAAEKAGDRLPAGPGGGKGEQPPAGKQDPMIPNEITNTANYAFATATDGSLTDMSTGTTQLLAANIDDTASALTNIGFDFFFQGTRFTQFSINDNGVLRLGATAQTSTPYQPLAQTNIPLITAYGGDQRTHAGDGKVHFKVTGSAPNRVLVVEWLNIQSNFNTGGTADLTYQVRLSETTGVIEFVYGSMTMSTLGAADTNSNDPQIGFSSTNTAGNVGSVTAAQSGTPAPTFNGASATPVNNLYTAGSITVLSSATDGVRRRFTFTPPTPTAPTGLNFTGVTQLAMTLNWTDSPDELLYGVYRSTDGTNFSFDGTAAQNATSYNATSLNPGTTYFWRVFAISEGALSTALAGSQATNPAGNINSTAAGGNWSAPATWVGGVVPGAGDNATIVTGATVTIDSSNCLSLVIQSGATLQYEATTARTLTVGQSVTINNGGVFQSAATGTQTGHVLSVGGDLINNGTIDFSTNGNTAAAGITFTGATDAAFTLGGGSTTDLKQTAGVTLNKGTNNTPVLTFTPGGTFTVLGANTAGFLTITTGTFKIGGANAFSNPLFNVAAYSIPAAGGLWIDNPNATIVGQNGSPTVTGMYRMSQGTYNIGIATGNSMGFAAGANIMVEGGAINATGRFGVAASGNAITYNQTAGTITVCTIGNASTTLGSFDLGTGVGTTNITGGTIVVQLANTGGSGPRDFRNQSGLTGTTTVTGGTVQLGNAASGTAKAFSIAGVFPDLVISNTSANHSATFLAPAVFNNITRNITINTGTTLNIGNNVFLMNGTTLTNNGTLTANGASSNFVWFLTTSPQLYTGTGAVTAPVTNFAIQADQGLTIDAASSNIVVTAIRLFSGSLTNSNKITLGNGGATTGTVQIGNTTTPTAAGNFDVAFTFNLGTGGQVMSYLRTTATRTTGPEINPTRILTSMTYDDNDATHNLAISGGDITCSATATALTMTNGRIVTGTNNLILSSGTATVTRTNGYVDGNFRKTYAAAANKNFEVGTANGFSPVAVNVTAGTFPATFTAKAVQGAHPNMLSPTHALQRYWVLTEGGDVTADLTFTYLDPTDIPVDAVEANFVIFKFDGTFTMPGGTVNTGANTANITGVTSFSDWTLAEPGAPTDVHLMSFTADESEGLTNSPGGGVLLRWQTGYEVANLGFNIYRDEGGKRTRVTPGLVAGSALFVGARTALGAGRSYAWVDTQAPGDGGQYWLEEVDVNGTSRWHGPVFAGRSHGVRSIPLSNIQQSPLISDLGRGVAHENRSAQVERKAKIAGQMLARAAGQSALASQPAIKLSVRNEGWFKVTQPELVAAGLDPAVDARLLQLFVDGQEQAINVVGARDGEFGAGAAIEYYGVGLDTPSTDTRTYWLVAGTTPGKRILQVRERGPAATAASFPYTVERRDKVVYFAALRNGDKENFFGPVVTANSVDQSIMISRLDQAGGQAQLEVRLQGVTAAAHMVRVQLNGSNVGFVSFDGQAEGTGRFTVAPSLLRDGQNVIALTAQGAVNDISLVGAVRLTYPHRYEADENALRLTAQGNQALTIGGFTSDQIRVIDVSNAGAAQEVMGQVSQGKGGYSITFTPSGAGARQLLAFVDQGARPTRIEADRPSSWRQASNGADLVIITRRELMGALEPLKALRQSQGLKVSVVDLFDVFDEFSFGQKSPQAIKDFLSYAATSWKVSPRYALFVGDASLDPRNYFGQGDSDLVPTRMIDTAYMETGSDDSLSDFDGDGLADIAIGRLPVRSAAEASAIVSKIIAYERSTAAEGVLLVSDIGDTYNFEDATTQLRALIPTDVRVERIDRGRMPAAEAKEKLIEILNRGPKVVNYTGHGSINLWRGDLLTAGDVLDLTNEQNQPLFITMTCLNGYYLDPATISLAEVLLGAEHGGAVAVWASSGMTLPDGQALMNREMFRNIFAGRAMTLGEATVKAKAAVGDPDVRRTWILFGDPSARIR